MKQLILLRHAKSDWSDSYISDYERPLNKRGYKTAFVLGRYFKMEQLYPDLVICSTATRTRETLEEIEKSSGLQFNINYLTRLYRGSVKDLLSILQEINTDYNTVMIVGHNPCIQDTAIQLSNASESNIRTKIHAKVPTGSLIALNFNTNSFAHISLKNGKLMQFIRPKHELTALVNSKKSKSWLY